MLDIPLSLLQDLSEKLAERERDEEEWFNHREKTANRDIDYYKKLRASKQATDMERTLASHIINNEREIMGRIVVSKMMTSFTVQLAKITELAFSLVDEEIANLKQPSRVVPEAESGKIIKLEKDLEKLKRQNKKWQPYLDMLKVGSENKQKWLKENR